MEAFVGGVMGGGGLELIGMLVLGIGPLASGGKLGFEPMVLGSIGQGGASFGNLENFSTSLAI